VPRQAALLGNVEPLLAAIMFTGSFAGVQLGVWAARRLGARRLRRYFTIVVGIGILIILWDLGKRIWL
jgi:uncharacterized membrane protein YfcA